MDWKNLFTAASLLLSTLPAWAIQIDPEPERIRKMALVYEHGRGVKQDLEKAYSLYCQAALLGDGLSAYNIGFMYFNGRGVARNLGMAVYWYQKAAKFGDHFSRTVLVRFHDVPAVEDKSCHPAPPLPAVKSASLSAEELSNPNREIVLAWVKQIAPTYSVDPELVMAVIFAESAYNPGALSPKNAQGLMQLIPATAQRFGVKDPWNPLENIKGGVAYLNWLLRHFSGNVELAVAAYNAGEGAVDRHQGVPPYHETQAYVKKILAHYPKSTHPIPPTPTDKASQASG